MISKKKNMNTTSEQKKKKRVKGSEAQQERNFKCFCGKTYLSYPALYLHKKLKHSEENQDQESKHISKLNEQQINENGKSQEEHSKDSSIQELLNFMKQCSETFVIKDEEKNDITNSEIQQKYIKNFPSEWFQKKEDYQPLIINLQEIYENLKDRGEFDEDEAEDEQDIKKTKCNKIFALYLAKLSKHLTVEGFKEIAYFITLFRLTLNQVGQKLIKNQQIEYGEEYCEQQCGEYCLEACNDFIISFIPSFLKSCPYKNFQCIDSETMGKSVKLTQYLSSWLFDNNFTHSKLLLSKDD